MQSTEREEKHKKIAEKEEEETLGFVRKLSNNKKFSLRSFFIKPRTGLTILRLEKL